MSRDAANFLEGQHRRYRKALESVYRRTVFRDFIESSKASSAGQRYCIQGVAPSCEAITPISHFRHEPERTALYRVLQENFETFLAASQKDSDRGPLPSHVYQEVEAYLRRQWVSSFPFSVRYILAYKPQLFAAKITIHRGRIRRNENPASGTFSVCWVFCNTVSGPFTCLNESATLS